MTPKILVAGLGNIFKGDDGFGVEVAARLAPRVDASVARVVDFGIRGIDLAFVLLDGGYDLVIFVDAVQRGGPPGTVYLSTPDADDFAPDSDNGAAGGGAATHGTHPAQVLGWVKALGGCLGALRLVGCEPADLCSDDDLRMGLSEPVSLAVEPAVSVIKEVIEKHLDDALAAGAAKGGILSSRPGRDETRKETT